MCREECVVLPLQGECSHHVSHGLNGNPQQIMCAVNSMTDNSLGCL
jgi:hypothetical protein